MKLKINWDGLGIITSIACAIHCGFLPLIVPVLPLFGINIIHNAAFEWGMIALAFFVGIYSLYHGFIKHHHSYKPVYIFLVGFVFLVAKQFLPSYEYLLLSIAVIFIISAHYMNYKMCQRSKCSSPHHKH
jgi:hypothetical protein